MEKEFLNGVALVKKKGNKIFIVESPLGEGGETPIILNGIPRKLVDKLSDIVSVKDFGAKGDGVTDDTEAIQRAMTSSVITGRNVFFPEGVYNVMATITCAPVFIFSNGNATLVFNDLRGADGLSFMSSQTTGRYVGMSGFTLICKGSNGGTGIKTPKDSSQYADYHTRYIFTDLCCRGFEKNPTGYANCWLNSFEKWLSIGDCVGALASNIIIQGSFDIKTDPSGQAPTVGIYLSASSAALTVRMTNLELGNLRDAVLVGSNVFYSLNAFDFIGVYNGVAQEGSKAFNEPKIWNGNINCQNVGVHLENTSSRDVSSVTIRRHSAGWKGATNDWYGVKAINCTDLNIRNCMVQPDKSDGAFNGAARAVYVQQCTGVRIHGNCVGVIAIGIEINNSTNFVIDDTVTLQNKETDILFNLTNNARLGSIGQYTTVSTFKGKVIEKDSTVTGAIPMLNSAFDLQANGNVNLDLTRQTSASDEKKWRFSVGSNQFGVQAVSDSGSGTNAILITRAGNTLSKVELKAESVVANGTTTTNMVIPSRDDFFSLGSAELKYSQLYAATGTINTSDEREKTTIVDPDEALMRAWGKVNYKVFQFKEAVEKKGEGARLHVGVIAQQVIDAFKSEGLDATRYGILCYDKWDDQYEGVVVIDEPGYTDENGNEVPDKTHTEKRLVMPASDRYGIRYEEALALESAYQRWQFKKIQIMLKDNGIGF